IRDKALSDRLGAMELAATVQGRLADLRRREPAEQDSRVQVGQYAPVMIMQEGRRTVVPMRYHCRLPGWTAFVERQHPDTYQARRGDLRKTWSKLFGYRHGVLVVTRFYETPAKPEACRGQEPAGGRDEDALLEFNPTLPRAMLVPCLWNFSPPSTPEERDIFSFAAITDASPPEVAATGHAHCIVSMKRESLDAWLNPDPNNLAALHAILDSRETGGPFDIQACSPLRLRRLPSSLGHPSPAS
ncbi:MAG TPA: SOS response-associated peptidase family protein, partial [Acidobacteriaceae bacterium]|nr:SOS response-associated peptidase family protein [Acidobacteriaceae bacterium]